MSELVVRAFPDTAYANREAFNAALVYFDRIVIPPIQPRAPLFLTCDSDLARTLSRMGLDVESAIKREQDAQQLSHFLGELAAAGVVSVLPSEFPREYKLAEDFINRAANDPVTVPLLQPAADRSNTWLEQGFSVHRQHGPETEAGIRRIWYTMAAVHSMMSAAELGHTVAAFAPPDYAALRAIQVVGEEGHVDHHSVVSLEILKLALPRLVVRRSEEVFEMRERLREFIEPLRIEVARLTAGLARDLPTSRLQDEVRTIVDRDISPRISELRRYLARPGRELAKHLVPDTAAIGLGALAITGAVVTGLPVGPALVGAPFLHLLQAALKARAARSEKMQTNPFTFAVLAEADES